MRISDNLRLDANETALFRRQLEFVDKQMYEAVFPENLARQYIPTQPGVPDWANVYTWQMYEKFGRAKIIGSHADDLPRADAKGQDASRIIKDLGAAYGYTIREIKRAQATGVPLDQMKAMAARFAIDAEMDNILANGLSTHNLEGLLSLTGANTFTPGAKTGGGTTWANGTPDEIAADLFGIVAKVITDMKNSGGPAFQKFVVLIPVSQYALIAQKRMGDGSNLTVLKYVLENSPWIEAIEPWHHCAGAGVGPSDRMVAYPRNPLVVAGIVPQEYVAMAPEQRNLEYIVNAIASTGGVVCRYPIAVCYGDGI
jgi:hypothetical protein